MFISKMNKVFHKHGKWAFAILTVLIIIPFVLYFSAAPEEILGSLGRGVGNSKFGMYGKRIPQKEFDRAVTGTEIYLLMQGFSPNYMNSPEGKKQVESFALDRLRLIRKATSLGITVSDMDVATFLKGIQFLSNNGAFDYSRYQMFLYSMRQYGYSEDNIINSIKDTVKINDLMSLVTDSVTNTSAGVEEYYNSMNLTYKVRSETFLSKDYLSKVKVSDKDLETYFSHNQSKYVVPRESKACLVEFPYSKYMAEAEKSVTQKSIDDYYTTHKAVYGKEKEIAAKVAIKQQLLNQFCEDKAKNDAQNFAVSVFRLVESKTDVSPVTLFQNYANENKDNLYGDTPWFSAKATKIKNIKDATALVSTISSLFLDQPISNAVKAGDSYFVACLVDKKDARPATFDEVKTEVLSDYKDVKSLGLAKIAANDIRNSVTKDISAPKVNIAKTLTINGFQKSVSINTQSFSSTPNAEQILNAISSVKVGEVSSLVDVNGGVLVFYLESIITPTKADFEKNKAVTQMQYTQFLKQNAWANYMMNLRNSSNTVEYK